MDPRIKKIQQLIDDLDWPQARVARLAKITAPHLSNLLSGKVKNPHENTLDKLEERLRGAIADRAAANRIPLPPEPLRSEMNLDPTAADPERVAALAARIAAQREALAHRTGPLDPSSGEKPRVPFPWNPPDYLADASRKDRLETGLGIPMRTFVEGGSAVQYFDNALADKYLPTALIPRPEWGVSAFQVKGDSMAPRIMPGDIVFIGERLQHVRNGDILVVALKTGGLTIKNLKIVDAETWELVPTNPAHETVKLNVENEVDWYVPVLGWFCPHYTRREVPWERDA